MAVTSNTEDIFVPQNYIDSDGFSDTGKDVTFYRWYKYDSMPELCDGYSAVDDSSAEEVKNAINLFYCNTEITREVDADGNVTDIYPDDCDDAKLVSNGDYYYIIGYENDATEIPFDFESQKTNTNFMLYFFDTETNTLHKYYATW